MGRYDDALADFTRAIELDPSHGDYAVNENGHVDLAR
jgi:Tetratricopeptide repeat